MLFVDVAGFTGMSERVGSEAEHDVVNSPVEYLVPLVERYGGVVDKFIGDEIMAVFGAPRSIERHAEHALRAALEMFAALDEYNRSRGLALALHAGVNTGEVIAGRVTQLGSMRGCVELKRSNGCRQTRVALVLPRELRQAVPT